MVILTIILNSILYMDVAHKHKKYSEKVKAIRRKKTFNSETTKKITGLIKNTVYIKSEIKMDSMPTNPFIGTTLYGGETIVFKIGERSYTFTYYDSTIIKYDDSEHEILMDELDEKINAGETNIDLTDSIYDNLINNQIIVGHLYKCEKCVEVLKLPSYDKLHKFTRYIVDLIDKRSL